MLPKLCHLDNDLVIIILWVTTQTQLFLITPPKNLFFSLAGEWPKLFRENNVELTRFDGVCTPVFAQKLANFPEGLLCPMPRRPLMVRAALLRRSCDGVAAATQLHRPAPSRSFCASRLRLRRAYSARRVR